MRARRGLTPRRHCGPTRRRRPGSAARAVDQWLAFDPFHGQVIAGASTVPKETDLRPMPCPAMPARGQVRMKHLLQTRPVDGVRSASLRGDDPLTRPAPGTGVPAVFGRQGDPGTPRCARRPSMIVNSR
ncbi:hypothetical protein GCM10010195_51480 [Kitasatospora griseola]|nr:hypothetical protein GCM10010195_51480 [Kitasatospora griseola]